MPCCGPMLLQQWPCSNWSVSPTCQAHSSKPAAVAFGSWMGQTDRRKTVSSTLLHIAVLAVPITGSQAYQWVNLVRTVGHINLISLCIARHGHRLTCLRWCLPLPLQCRRLLLWLLLQSRLRLTQWTWPFRYLVYCSCTCLRVMFPINFDEKTLLFFPFPTDHVYWCNQFI